MKITSELDTTQVSSFADNHRHQTIVLGSYNTDENDKSTEGVIYTADLTLNEFKLICDIITSNLENNGKV